LTRLPLDEPIEGERALEAVAALLVVQWRHLNLTRQQLPQQQACMGCVSAEERLDVPQARLEFYPCGDPRPFQQRSQPC